MFTAWRKKSIDILNLKHAELQELIQDDDDELSCQFNNINKLHAYIIEIKNKVSLQCNAESSILLIKNLFASWIEPYQNLKQLVSNEIEKLRMQSNIEISVDNSLQLSDVTLPQDWIEDWYKVTNYESDNKQITLRQFNALVNQQLKDYCT